jgi:hypothetical protein
VRSSAAAGSIPEHAHADMLTPRKVAQERMAVEGVATCSPRVLSSTVPLVLLGRSLTARRTAVGQVGRQAGCWVVATPTLIWVERAGSIPRLEIGRQHVYSRRYGTDLLSGVARADSADGVGEPDSERVRRHSTRSVSGPLTGEHCVSESGTLIGRQLPCPFAARRVTGRLRPRARGGACHQDQQENRNGGPDGA